MGLEAQGKQNADLVRAMEGLAGGVGFCGDICGALTGGACLLALYAGRGLPDEGEDSRLNLMIADLAEWFSQDFRHATTGFTAGRFWMITQETSLRDVLELLQRLIIRSRLYFLTMVLIFQKASNGSG